MRSKDIIKRIERLGRRVVAKSGKGSHTKTCKSIEITLAPCQGEGWLRRSG